MPITARVRERYTQNKQRQPNLPAGMATSPYPAQVDANGCVVEGAKIPPNR